MVIRQIIYLRTNVSAIFVTDGNERAWPSLNVCVGGGKSFWSDQHNLVPGVLFPTPASPRPPPPAPLAITQSVIVAWPSRDFFVYICVPLTQVG